MTGALDELLADESALTWVLLGGAGEPVRRRPGTEWLLEDEGR